MERLADNLGLVQADDFFEKTIVVGIADAAELRPDTRVGQTLGVSNRDVLDATIA